MSMTIPMVSGGKKPKSPGDPTMDDRFSGAWDITNVAPSPSAKDVEFVPGEILVGFGGWGGFCGHFSLVSLADKLKVWSSWVMDRRYIRFGI